MYHMKEKAWCNKNTRVTRMNPMHKEILNHYGRSKINNSKTSKQYVCYIKIGGTQTHSMHRLPTEIKMYIIHYLALHSTDLKILYCRVENRWSSLI